jgi:hypothetical protein
VLRERVLLRGDLYRAEGLAVISSLRGWRAATLPGPKLVTEQLPDSNARSRWASLSSSVS